MVKHLFRVVFRGIAAYLIVHYCIPGAPEWACGVTGTICALSTEQR